MNEKPFGSAALLCGKLCETAMSLRALDNWKSHIDSFGVSLRAFTEAKPLALTGSFDVALRAFTDQKPLTESFGIALRAFTEAKPLALTRSFDVALRAFTDQKPLT